MNWYFWRFWLPLQLLTLATFGGILAGVITVNWWIVFASWFMLGVIGVGVGYHRLFSHRSFETWKPVEYALGTLGTLAAYCPVSFWTAIHQQHHRVSDTEKDPSSPRQHGFWESFLWYRMREENLKKISIKNYCFIRLAKDPYLMWLSKNFEILNWIAIVGVGLISIDLMASLLIIPMFIEHLRVNFVSSLSHMNVPFSYQNHQTSDDSQNNVLLGYLTFGFAWHNNHHHNARAVSLHEKWWEVDVEGMIAKWLTKK